MERFHEAQPLQPTRFRWLVAFPPALVTALAIAQRWRGQPLGAHTLSNAEFASLGLFLWLVYVWLSRVQLATDVDDTAISIRLRGLPRHHRIPLNAVRAASVVTFDADRDFGGIGFRAVQGGRAYVTQGTGGVRLELDRGGFAVIGSARPAELLAAVRPTQAN
jgi:hypothetical protein